MKTNKRKRVDKMDMHLLLHSNADKVRQKYSFARLRRWTATGKLFIKNCYHDYHGAGWVPVKVTYCSKQENECLEWKCINWVGYSKVCKWWKKNECVKGVNGICPPVFSEKSGGDTIFRVCTTKLYKNVSLRHRIKDKINI